MQSEEYVREYGERYMDNVDVPPEYVAADEYNHALSETSPLRNAGRPLTTARGLGTGKLLPVQDPWYFYDGLGIDGEVGDMIVIGDNQPARVEKADLQERELVLDREVQWFDGDPVGLAWSGPAPDMGVYEYGDGGRPSVQIVADPFIAAPGQEITLTAVIRGDMEPSDFVWHAGYKDRMTGQTITLSRDEPNDYPIRLQVTDSAGNTHRTTGYVVVQEPRRPGEPMLHSTFNADDEDWWWHWQAYRPRPADYERILEDNNGWLKVFAPEDRGRLPCWVQPKRWNIDEFPMVTLRYKIGEGTPVGLYLRAFGSADHPTRRVCVAKSPAAQVGDEQIAENVLADDGGWHMLSFDARIIRDRFPKVTVLEAMRFNASLRRDVTKGMWFGLDEVTIAPE